MDKAQGNEKSLPATCRCATFFFPGVFVCERQIKPRADLSGVFTGILEETEVTANVPPL